MPTWIGLFRGINVGGHQVLPMAELRAHLEALGLKQVRSYIQSGNVLFESAARNAASLAKKITAQVEQHHGFRPQLLLLTAVELQAAVDQNPFPDATSEPKTLHFFFLADAAKTPDRAAIEKAKRPSEHYRITSRVFYLHAPEGLARSKLAARAESYLGVAATARNFRTVEKLLTMADA